jgi:geranylgeranyl reductase family protein
MEHRDVVIVGAGPAGSTCAWKLRQAGVDVVVIDRQEFPRDKTCAGWITPDVIEALGLSPGDYGRGRVIEPIEAFRVGIIGGGAVDVPFGRPVSYGIRRAEFDQFLIARAGADFRPGTRVATLDRRGDRWIVNGHIETPVIVGAGGHFCPVARALNPGSEAASAIVTQEAEVGADSCGDSPVRAGVPEFYFAPDFEGYGWVLRKGPVVTIGIGRRASRDIHDHLHAFTDFLRGTGRVRDLQSARWRGHAYFLHGASPRSPVADGALLVGDSAGLAHPSSGEGILSAIESGRLAAETILDAAGDYRRSRLEAYRERIVRRLGPEKRGRGLRRILPRPVEHTLGRRLVTSPWFARRVVLERWFLHT